MEKVGIIGLGYVGLPLASLCAKKGHNTVGLDKKSEVVDQLNAGKSHIQDALTETWVKEAHKTGKLHATTDEKELEDCNVLIICVPTPIDKDKKPNTDPLVEASAVVAKHLKEKDLVIVESTVFPGTCENIIKPVLEKESGLEAGKDFYLAHCPERVNPGDVLWTTENIPRVVGALTPEGTEKAAIFYKTLLGGEIFDVTDIKKALRPKIIVENGDYRINTLPFGTITKMHSIRDAEAVKAMENTVRDVNIAFVNELAKISSVLELDVLDIIEGMATKPFGKGPFYPGVGVGGHCISVDPEWLKEASTKAGYIPELISLARKTNNSMPSFTVNLLKKSLKDLSKAKVALLGVSYKGNVDDPRESPFYAVKELLEQEGVTFSVYDPLFTKENTVASVEEAVEKVDAILLVTDHKEFKDILTADFLVKQGVKVVVDGRNCLEREEIVSAGIVYKGIGR